MQNTDQWKLDRLGHVTASEVHKVLAKGRDGMESKTRKAYMQQLINEHLTGEFMEGFETEDMEWGHYAEPLARKAYEEETGYKVTECEFIKHPSIKWFGASPDGLVLDVGCLEIKCMKSENHRACIKKKIKRQHILQMQTQMLCTERWWCDYVLYDPRQDEDWQLDVRRVKRDPVICADIIVGTNRFLKEMREIIEGMAA